MAKVVTRRHAAALGLGYDSAGWSGLVAPARTPDEKIKRGWHGDPVGTIAFYGPDERRATKVAVSILSRPQSEPTELRRWFVDAGDARADETIFAEIATLLRGP